MVYKNRQYAINFLTIIIAKWGTKKPVVYGMYSIPPSILFPTMHSDCQKINSILSVFIYQCFQIFAMFMLLLLAFLELMLLILVFYVLLKMVRE